jgi:hypothetical protein
VRFQFQHNTAGRTGQGDEWQRKRADEVAVADDFAPLHRPNEGGTQQPGEENSQSPEPFERRREQTQHEKNYLRFKGQKTFLFRKSEARNPLIASDTPLTGF